MSMIFMKCPKCNEENYVICGNCEKYDAFEELSKTAAVCICTNQIQETQCRCGAEINRKLYSKNIDKENQFKQAVASGRIRLTPNPYWKVVKYLIQVTVIFIVVFCLVLGFLPKGDLTSSGAIACIIMSMAIAIFFRWLISLVKNFGNER